MSASLFLAWRNITRHRMRSFAALAAIATGVTALMLASGFIEWGLWFGRESTIGSGLGHIRVFRAGYQQSGLADPFAFLVPQQTEALKSIESIPEVRVMAPRLAFSGLISKGETTISFIGEGVAPLQEEALSRSLTIVQGRNLDEAHGAGIIVGQGLAANLGVNPGDKVVLLVNTESGGVNAVDAEVRGLFATITKAYDDSALRVPIALAQKLLKVSGAHAYVLVLDETEHTQRVLTSLRQRFGGGELEFVPWRDMADFYNKTAELFSRQMAVVRLIIAAIIVLSISNSMIMSVLERTSEIGTSMALGVRRKGVLQLFLSEGFLLGVLGGLVGVIFGTVTAKLISAVGIPMPPAPGMALGYTAEVRVTWSIAMQAFILAVASSLAASVLPAWKAGRMRIVDALRHNR